MTFDQIKEELGRAGKPVSTVQIHRYMRKCKIKALLPLTKPRNYSNHASFAILKWLNLAGPAALHRAETGFPSLATLKRTAKAARRAGR